MTADNGNGELRELIQLRRSYRADLSRIEDQEKALKTEKKDLKTRYIEVAVDVADRIFPDTVESKPAPAPAPSPKVEEVEAEPESPKCPECETPVAEGDKFCANCAYPLKEENENIGSSPTRLTVTGSQRRPRRRS